MSVINKAFKVANTANKGKIAIRVEKTYPESSFGFADYLFLIKNYTNSVYFD